MSVNLSVSDLFSFAIHGIEAISSASISCVRVSAPELIWSNNSTRLGKLESPFGFNNSEFDKVAPGLPSMECRVSFAENGGILMPEKVQSHRSPNLRDRAGMFCCRGGPIGFSVMHSFAHCTRGNLTG